MIGSVISSYAVQDKQQVADIDPALVVEEDSPEENEPCIVCDTMEETSPLLICDGCESYCHVFCAGLEEVPEGDWFCPRCMETPHPNRLRMAGRQRSRRVVPRRPPHDTTRDRANRTTSAAWARVWQSVHNSLDFDLDFPFDDELSYQERIDAERRRISRWEDRARVAAQQGDGRRFRENAASILRGARQPNTQRILPQPPKPESQEELRAWNAFEKARQVMDDPEPANRRKRKSATASPAEPDPEPERKLKRPRTHRLPRNPDNGEGPSENAPEPSLVARTNGDAAEPASSRRDQSSPGPTFLQTLLKEVEDNNIESESRNLAHPLIAPVAVDHSSPRASSPGASPRGSNNATPRNMTPPPLNLGRPMSPPLTSSIIPVYPLAPTFPPFSPAEDERSDGDVRQNHRKLHARGRKDAVSPATSPTRSKGGSPSRAFLSLSTKSEIQRMVTAALKPMYGRKEVTKDEYTDINRDVSRKMYDRVGGADALEDQAARERWQRVALDEVENAVKALRNNPLDVTAS